MSEKEFIECIKKDDLIKDITISNFNNYKPVFILCQNSLSFFPNIKKIINRQISENDKVLISSSSLTLIESVEQIKELYRNKNEMAIANAAFLTKIGISPFSLIKTNIYCSINNNKIILYFSRERKYLLIEKNNSLRLPNWNVNNNNLMIKPDLKIRVLNSLILIYANKKEIIRLCSSNSTEKYNLEKYTLINKAWIGKFKEIYNYNEIKNKISHFQYNTYDEFSTNLSYFDSLDTFKNFTINFEKIPEILSQKIKLSPTIKVSQSNDKIKWPINFEIIHQSLFNILKTFSIYINDLNNFQSEYKIIFGNSTLYLQSKNMLNCFYVYSFDNNIIYKLFAFILFNNEFFFFQN